MSAGPLAGTFARLGRENPYRRLVVGDPGPGWTGWDDAFSDEAFVDRWFARMLAAAGGHRDVAGSYMVMAATAAVVEVTTAALVVERRAFSLAPADIAFRLDGGGWCGGLAVRSPVVRVLADDPAADHADAQVAEWADLVGGTAAGLAALLPMAFEPIRLRAPFGRPGMWGSVADHAGLVAARWERAGLPGAWQSGTELLDALAAAVPTLRARPRLVPVDVGGKPVPFAIRGTCCLLFKASPGADRSTGAGYCSTCPLLPEPAQRALLAAAARREAGPGPQEGL